MTGAVMWRPASAYNESADKHMAPTGGLCDTFQQPNYNILNIAIYMT